MTVPSVKSLLLLNDGQNCSRTVAGSFHWVASCVSGAVTLYHLSISILQCVIENISLLLIRWIELVGFLLWFRPHECVRLVHLRGSAVFILLLLIDLLRLEVRQALSQMVFLPLEAVVIWSSSMCSVSHSRLSTVRRLSTIVMKGFLR